MSKSSIFDKNRKKLREILEIVYGILILLKVNEKSKRKRAARLLKASPPEGSFKIEESWKVRVF